MTKQMDDLMKPAGWRWLDTGMYRKTLPKTAEVGAWTPLYTELQMRRLYAENESLRADAERYRWLRETRFIWSDFSYICGVHPTTVGIEFRWFATDSKKPTRDDLDKAITAAIRERE